MGLDFKVLAENKSVFCCSGHFCNTVEATSSICHH